MDKNSSSIKTGVIGTGSMGINHVRLYSEISNLVGVSDVNEEHGRKVAKNFGVKYFRDYGELLSHVDAVSIAVPTSFHLAVAKDACRAGVNILVEKPLASSVKEAELIIQESIKANVILAVGHVERHNPVVRYAKTAIDRGEWGDVITLSSRRVSNFPYRIHDVGVLLDLSIHDIDITNYLANSKVNDVFAVGGNLKSERHEDHVNLVMKHSSGVISICETNWLTPMKIRKLGITTSHYFIELDYNKQSIITFKSSIKDLEKTNLYKAKVEFKENIIPITKEEPLLIELRDFLNCIETGKKPVVSGEEGLEVLKISEAALKSLKRGKVINLV